MPYLHLALLSDVALRPGISGHVAEHASCRHGGGRHQIHLHACCP